MKLTGLVFPHQLFEKSPLVPLCSTIYLVEEFLFFRQYHFHKQKIAFHRAAMKYYETFLQKQGVKVMYIDAQDARSDIRQLIPHLQTAGVDHLQYIDPTDNWLEKRIIQACRQCQVSYIKHPSPLFFNSVKELENYFGQKKRFFQTDFYIHQRISRNILLEKDQKPLGGKWTYDVENRLKYPKNQVPPAVQFQSGNKYYKEAIKYTLLHFKENYGEINTSFLYPCTFEESRKWLHEFLEKRFADFGKYEDAILEGEHILHHGVLTPMLNTGLLTPQQVIEEALSYASGEVIPLNSIEGFVRQVIGWREFMRAVYELKGTEERNKNFWGFTRKIPESFWKGTTGIEPVDSTIKKVLKTGYCHHIERLMVLGNFMLLCEFDPDEVYRWFMELFIDAYDWVMVPNVYGMSQFSDGGLMSTKPYISGSNYLMKMSDYKKGSWQASWDGLFWRFMHVHRAFFLKNPRLGMLVRTFDKMPAAKREAHLQEAELFLSRLS